MVTAPATMTPPQAGTWTTAPRPQSVGFPPSRGAAIRRGADQQQITDCSYTTKLLNQTEKDALIQTFYQTDLSGGALEFDMTDPDSATTKQFVFTERPVATEVQGSVDLYRVTIQLERIDN